MPVTKAGTKSARSAASHRVSRPWPGVVGGVGWAGACIGAHHVQWAQLLHYCIRSTAVEYRS